jgi:hypothetical protein
MRRPWDLRPALARALVLLAGIPAPSARAAETRDDVETDHLDAADDGGPRTWGLAVRPFELDFGLVGAEVGVSLVDRVVLTFEPSWWAPDPSLAYGVTVGLAFFPTRFSFHGFYLHPRLEAWRAPATGNAVGIGATLGYEWTAPLGATLRLGGGLAYATWEGAASGVATPATLTGLLPELDAAIGWVF